MRQNAQRISDSRLIVIQALIVLWMVVIGGRLFYLQVGQHDWLRARAERQQQFEIPLSPKRGLILDRNMNELARSVEVKSLYASPSIIKDKNPEAIAEKLARALDIDKDDLLRRLTSTNLAAVAVKLKLSNEEVARVEALDLPGLHFVKEMKRFYVGGSTAAHIIGFVNSEEEGKGGIEQAYEKLIGGQGGRLLLDVDALKNSYGHEIEESIPGANVRLTIDVMIQHYVEKALAAAVRATRSRGGTIVITRPATGEILALASYPTFDPNKISESTEEQRRNRAVEVAFEPGSIFKIVPYSAAIEEGIIQPNTLIDCGGQIRIADRVIHDGRYGVLTATQALAKSSNVAAIKIGQRLGNELLASYIERFGFGRRTGIELPAESRGLFRPAKEWGPTTIGSIPMGHEIGVTAVQMAAAFACIANGGEYISPYLVSEVTAASGETLEQHKSEPRRIISEHTASVLKKMLESVVIQGTGKRAQIGGYRAAGKTGTAQKIDEVTRRYSNTRYIASFAGFAPVDSPEIVCIVSLDEPKGAYHGGDAAAPVFARVVADALHILGVPPEDDPQADLVAGDFHSFDLAPPLLEDEAIAEEENDPRPALDVAEGPEIASKRGGTIVVPDLKGRGVREAVALCVARGLKIKATGEGVVSGQSPPPGTLVNRDAVCIVRLSRQAGRKQAGGD